MPHGITQCYLPPGRGDIPALTPAEAGIRFNEPGGTQGWVDLADPNPNCHLTLIILTLTRFPKKTGGREGDDCPGRPLSSASRQLAATAIRSAPPPCLCNWWWQQWWSGEMLLLLLLSGSAQYDSDDDWCFAVNPPNGTAGKGGNVTSAGWQVTLCDPMWHVSCRSREAGCRPLYSVTLFIQ